jgi:hypothetical protein
MALHTRKHESVIHHSDQGSQYTSIAFGSRCKETGVRPSMGTVGDPYDNAMAESFFASLECELINRRSWKSQAEARTALFIWIEGSVRGMGSTSAFVNCPVIHGTSAIFPRSSGLCSKRCAATASFSANTVGAGGLTRPWAISSIARSIRSLRRIRSLSRTCTE